ncbi:hypothetical protein [Streptomyces himalayensis]|uniref:Uncharacterized protein n=1 Tax=Streptomyces himalayensis subsp. himalayensis TaxID=2756131 RepID=A0A7W0I951_9ACTN|nr:hypothetical protein [Streptomyces himalayensis]MBA2946908.1 hypothetical protein [Streptomyces himalayensis subsp. himalayensis]
MSTAQHLDTVLLLCSREFPAEHGRWHGGFCGPGYHIAELVVVDGFRGGGCSQLLEAREQYEAECVALSERLSHRWGPPVPVSLYSVLHRAMADGEDIPEPWHMLSTRVQDVQVWRSDERWVVLGGSPWGEESPFHLLAAVTEVDPP